MTTIYVRQTDSLPARREAEFYPTERPLIYAALNYFSPAANSILDIGAGDGRWGQIAAELSGASRLTGVDIRRLPRPSGFTDWFTGDFLTWQRPAGGFFDLIVSNPPYNIAEAVIYRAWEMLAPGGMMLMLLRLAFMAGIDRFRRLWAEIPPATVGVLSRRPSFYGGGTNGTDYGVYCWRKTESGEPAGRPRRWETALIYYERGDAPAYSLLTD